MFKEQKRYHCKRKSIEKRPEIVLSNEEFGHFEVDLIVGAEHKEAILTMNDRATGYTFLELLQGKSAEEVRLKTERIITENQLTIHTLTTDNGKEIEDSTRPNRKNIKHRVNLQSTRSCQSV
ncbi:hypothetical protein BPO_0534 [Bergeyella porcorum]|uniref:Integrase catalytic domain-containing protein n=1 Tax=Bergeyella porcorum TaxID=1735111 RepID=A0AAU0EZB4_9FLAO